MYEYIKQDKQIASAFNYSDPRFVLFDKHIVYPGDSISNIIVDKTKQFLNK
jgi:hypothetical protein